MAEGFVEQLEIADVEQDDGTTLALAQHVLEVPERGLPIGDVEQGIVIGHVLKLAGMEHAFGDVGAADEVDHLIVEPPDLFMAELEINLLAVLFDKAIPPFEDRTVDAGLVETEKGTVAD